MLHFNVLFVFIYLSMIVHEPTKFTITVNVSFLLKMSYTNPEKLIKQSDNQSFDLLILFIFRYSLYTSEQDAHVCMSNWTRLCYLVDN